MRKQARLLALIMLFLLFSPALSVMAAITPISDDEFEVTDYRVTLPEGSGGTVTLGGGKFQPAEAGGRYLSEVRLKANRTLDVNNYVTVTFDNGVKNTHNSEPGTPNVFAVGSGLMSNPSKGLTVTLTSDGSKERWLEIVSFKVIGSLPPGGGDPPDPGGGGNVSTAPSKAYYVPYRDEYRLDYTAPSGTAKYQLYFKTASGTVYTLDYDFKPTGIHYLTCNGTYNLNFFDASGKLIGKTAEVQTTQIQNPACRSYEDSEGAGRNELSAMIDPNGDMVWNDPPAGTKEVQIWKDGQLVATKGPTEKIYEQPGKGSYSVVAVGQDGSPLGQSDLNVGEGSSGGGDPGGEVPGGGSCGACEKLEELLQCPGWDQAMGDVTEAIRNALPPPPDWDDIADKIGRSTVRHLSDYLGPVPPPPSKEDIRQETETPLPPLDLTTGNENLVPNVPDEYKSGKIEFNLEKDAPQIEMKQDTTGGFDITEPLSNMDTDGPGVPVLPGDPNNHSDGIKKPDKPNIEEDMPKPGKIIFEIPKPDGPKPSTPEPGGSPANPAIPNNPGGDPALPNNPGGGPALPDATDGIIPIPSGGGG